MRLITAESRLELSRALHLMTEALDILDELRAPGEIGSILDLAATQLEKILDHDKRAAPAVQTLMFQLERELAAAPGSSISKPSPWEFRPV